MGRGDEAAPHEGSSAARAEAESGEISAAG